MDTYKPTRFAKYGINHAVWSSKIIVKMTKELISHSDIPSKGYMLIAATPSRVHSTMFSALNTSKPMLSPIDKVTPGALNLSHASIKLMAPTKPIHIKMDAVAIE